MGMTDLGFEPIVHGGCEPNSGGVSPAGCACAAGGVGCAAVPREEREGEGEVHVEERGAGRASGDEACIRERGVRT